MKDRDVRLVDLYQSGLTLREVGEQVGLSGERVRQILDELKVARRPSRRPPHNSTLEAVALVIESDAKVSISEAADRTGAQRSGVGWYIRVHCPDFDYKARRVVHVPLRDHGTLSRYSNQGCRCVECREANAQSTVMLPVAVFETMRQRVDDVRSWAIKTLKEAAGV